MGGCAPWARAAGLDPAGSAPVTPALVLVDRPRPWPRAVEEIEALAPLAGRARVQLVVPAEGDRGAGRRVRAYVRRPGRATYGRAEGRAPDGSVAALALELLAAAEEARAEAPIEVLVCAHGARDRCCGSLGTRLALGGGGEVTVERTSHLGGHRFAPTALTLPDGRYWAFLDADRLGAVVRRDGPVGAVLAHHRGSSLVDGPALQVLEAAAFARVGWGWDRWERAAAEEPDGTLRLDAVDERGRAWRWSARPGPSREIVVPPCGAGAPVVHRAPSLIGLRCDAPDA